MAWYSRFIRNKKLIWPAAVAVVIFGVIMLGGNKPVPIKVLALKPGQLRVIVNATTTSTIKSETEVTLSAQRTGRVTALPVKEGDMVRRGAIIARLDLTEEEVQSESTLEQSKATYDEADKNLKRMQDLFDKGMVAQQDIDGVRRTYEVAKSQYEAARDDVRVKKDYSVIKAPFDGVVSKKYTEVGELLVPGKQIVTIVNTDRIYVLATIDEVDVGRLKLGQSVTITVDAFPGEKFEGTIRRISPIVSGGKLETRTADVWIYFSKKDRRMKPGMSADVEILVATLENVISVPSQAVIERDGKKKIFIADGRDLKPGITTRARMLPVGVGETNWSFTQITDGLRSGEYIVTTPEAAGLKDEAKVRIEE